MNKLYLNKMKTNRILKAMLTFMAIALLSINISSCGDDGINGSTWKGQEDGYQLTVTFTSDDSGTWYGSRREGDRKITDNGTFQCKWHGSDKGTVTVRSDNRKEFHYGERWNDEVYPFVFSYVIKDNKMRLYDEEDDDDYFDLIRQ